MWRWRRKKPVPEGFPEGFTVQRIGISAAMAISEHPAFEIAKYFREHPEIAGALLGESYDKRIKDLDFCTQGSVGVGVIIPMSIVWSQGVGSPQISGDGIAATQVLFTRQSTRCGLSWKVPRCP